MGKKYIIELPENTHWIQWIMEGTKDHHPYMGFKQVEDLTPYTEPDMEQVRKEAYKEGREAGIKDGMCEAWEAARKVTQVREYGGYGDCLEEVFGRHRVSWDVFDYSASEAIEKIRQYEQEKEERIQVGDEIETPSGLKGYVVNFTDDELVHYVSSEGRFGTMGMSAVSKTGRHFPEIAEVLQKMKKS